MNEGRIVINYWCISHTKKDGKDFCSLYEVFLDHQIDCENCQDIDVEW